MNGPLKIYQTRQIVRHDFAVDLPKCMYAMKNIHSARNGMVDGSADHVSSSGKKLDIIDQVKQFLKNNHTIPGMAELEAQQDELLRQLADLKEQILSIKSELKIATIPATRTRSISATTTTATTTYEGPDIIINASPTNPPYSLEVIQKLLQNTVCLNITTHLHSTVSSLREEAKKLDSNLVNFNSKSNVPKVNVRLIWKNIASNTELLVSHVPILGEVNLLRYLTKAIQSPLSYNSDSDCIEIDSLLDICYLIVRARTKTERSGLLQSLNKSLGKSQWLLGRCQASVADIAAYSAIKQASNISEMSANLGKWFHRCEAVM